MSGVRNRLLVGDVRERLGDLPEASVDCVITSPPYYQLRDYGISGQLGLERTVEVWVAEMRLALAGLVRVLKLSGSLWLNLGDGYSRDAKFGAPRKSLLLGPERLLLALAADGWITRSKVIWAKTNPMPEAVADRLSTTYDVVYFLTRSPRYYFDLDAIRLPHRSNAAAEPGREELGKNPGDVWRMAGASFRGAHFATFPPTLVERPLLATCPELICDRCQTPYRRSSQERREEISRDRGDRRHEPRVRHYSHRYRVIRTRGPLLPDCGCASPARPGVVLDPFFGAGTAGLVAEQHGRDWIGIEINPVYARLAERRIAKARAASEDSMARRAA